MQHAHLLVAQLQAARDADVLFSLTFQIDVRKTFSCLLFQLRYIAEVAGLTRCKLEEVSERLVVISCHPLGCTMVKRVNYLHHEPQIGQQKSKPVQTSSKRHQITHRP